MRAWRGWGLQTHEEGHGGQMLLLVLSLGQREEEEEEEEMYQNVVSGLKK